MARPTRFRAASLRPGSPRAAACLALALSIAACAGGGAPATTPTPTPTSAPVGATPASSATPLPTVIPTPAPSPTPAVTPAPSPKRDPGTTRTDEKGVVQAWVPGGVFRIGSDAGSATGPAWARPGYDSEHPAHEVAVSHGYWIDVTEVTVAEFAAFKKAGGYDDPSLWSSEGWAWRQGMGASELPRPCIAETAQQPQVCVTWYEAEAYARWRGGRLPTEAEWEFAARGPQSLVYPWGNQFDATLANLDGATGSVDVGSYPGGASWIGALDMAGNAMEWVADWWSATYYRSEVRDDPTGPAEGNIKVEKGGWWGPPNNAGSFIARSSYRHFEDPPTYSDQHIGFRIITPG
jgi:formylglycine-generating enzyme required for sulfatase activity